MFCVKYFFVFPQTLHPLYSCSVLFLKKVLHQLARSGSELLKSLLHVSNGQNVVEIRVLQKGTKFGHLFLNVLYVSIQNRSFSDVVIDSTSGAGAILLLVLLVLYPLVDGIPVLGQIICAGRRWLIVYSRQRSRHLFCVCDFVFAFLFQIYFLCMFCVELHEGNNWRAPACFQFKLTYR
jgi:hypothetical protein